MYSTATLDVEVRLHSYSNPTHEDCSGLPCDIDGSCDNMFEFCVGVNTPQGFRCFSPKRISDVISDDVLTFNESALIELGVSNPLSFYDISTSVSNWTTLLHGICKCEHS